MGPSLLYWTYLAVMAAGLACFVRAFVLRRETPRHRRWATTGVVLTLGGIVVVLIVYRVLGWEVAKRSDEIVLWHRRLAYLATAMVVFMAVSGARRWPIHKQLYRVFFPLYVITLLLAIIGYRP